MSNEFEIWFFGTVRNGILEGIPKKKLAAQLKHFEGKAVELKIRKKKKYRSIQQNRFLWVCYNEVADQTGYTPDEVHEICKGMFLKTEKVNEKTGTIFKYVRSTTELSTTEFAEYVEAVVRFAAQEFQITLKMPEQQTEMNLVS